MSKNRIFPASFQAKIPKNLLNFVRDNFLLISILISIFIGFGIGIGLRNSSWANTENVLWFKLPGSLFIRSLELLIVPVIFVGVVAATSSLSAKSNLKITLICIGLTFLTHVIACIMGLFGSLILVSISNSNSNGTISESLIKTPEPQKTTYDIIADILRNLIPKNIIKSTTHQELTKYVLSDSNNQSSAYKRSVQYIDGTNVLGILVFAILLGFASSMLEKKAEMFIEFFKSTNDVIILILKWLISIAPIGIASLIIEAVLEVEDLGDSFKKIGLFAVLCVAVLLVYGTLVLGLMIVFFIRKNPLKYYLYFLEPMLLAFASTSGAVCIHKNLDICENTLKMDKRMSRFTIPFYTTIQADGSAIFIVMSCAFLANYTGILLSAGDYTVIIIMTSILCLCLPSVPSSSIVTILVVLNSVNLSYLNIALLYAVEWLLDRVRTAVNLYSHCFCAVITHDLCKKNIENLVNRLDETQDLDNTNSNVLFESSTSSNLLRNIDVNNNNVSDEELNRQHETTIL